MTESLYVGAVAAAAFILLCLALIAPAGRAAAPAETWVTEIFGRDEARNRLGRADDRTASRDGGPVGKFEQRAPIRQ